MIYKYDETNATYETAVAQTKNSKQSITKTRLLRKYIENFTSENWIFTGKKIRYLFSHISAQNIDRGNSLESPRRGGSNE